jgi:hypothetical protein
MTSARAALQGREIRRQLAKFWSYQSVAYHPWPRSGRPDLAAKPICTMYVCAMDHCLDLDQALIGTALDLAAEREEPAGRTRADVVRDVCQALDDARAAGWLWAPKLVRGRHYTGLLQWLFVKVAQPEAGSGVGARDGKLRLGSDPRRPALSLDQVDFLADLFRKGPGRLRIGGATALMAQALAKVCEEGNVAIWAALLSPAQAGLLPPALRALSLDSGRPSTQAACQSGRPGDPESHSFPFEYAAGLLSTDLPELQPEDVGRVVVTAPPLFYRANGRVDRRKSRNVRPIRGLFSDGSGSPVEAVGRAWPHWIVTGLQGVRGEEAEAGFERDLASIPAEVTLHVEIAGTAASPWLVRMLARHVDSLGIAEDELAGFASCVRDGAPCPAAPGRAQPVAGRLPDQDEIALAGVARTLLLHEQSMWLAERLSLERLYVHGHQVDLVLRRDRRALTAGRAGPEMTQELQAALFAKGEVVCRAAEQDSLASFPQGAVGLRSVTRRTEDPLAGSPRGDSPLPVAILAMASLLDRGGILGPGAANGPAPDVLAALRQGWFRCRAPGERSGDEFLVAVVPVIWFRAAPTHPLRTTGLGDVTSALSFYLGDYQVDPAVSKRLRSAGTGCQRPAPS